MILLKIIIISISYIASLPILAGTVTDARGQKITTATPPQRIISHTLTSDEILMTLLSDPIANKRLLAISPKATDSRFSNIHEQLPAQLAAKPLTTPEQIVAARPDLVLLSVFNRPELIRTLERNQQQRVFVIKAATTLEDIYQCIIDLGVLVHAETAARQLAQQTRAAMQQLQQRTTELHQVWGRKPRLIFYDPDGVAIGAETIFNDLVTQIGAENVAATAGLKGWPKLSIEMLASWQPDVIIAAGDNKDLTRLKTRLAKTPGWKNLKAFKDQRIILLTERQLYATSQYVVEAARTMQTQLLQSRP